MSIGKDETCEELEERIWPLGASLMYEVLCDIYKNNVDLKPQDENLVTFAPKLSQELAQIDWNMAGLSIHNLIRGLSSKPGAWMEVFLKGQFKRIKIYSTRFDDSLPHAPIGTLQLNADYDLLISCKGGVLVVKELQIEGKKRLPSAQVFKGMSLDNLKLKLTV